MKIKFFVAFIFTVGVLYIGVSVFANCPPGWVETGYTPFSCSQSVARIDWKIFWTDGNKENIFNTGTGQCCGGIFTSTTCPPRFDDPYTYPTSINGVPHQTWSQTTQDRRCNGSSCENNGNPSNERTTHSCSLYGGGGGNNECYLQCNSNPGFQQNPTYDDGNQCCEPSPVLIDVLGNGFALTDAANGVMFDFNGDDIAHKISWTAAGSDDAWLVLDRNGNGLIDSSLEMFGNFTQQTASEERNGFLALAEFDKAANGGNADDSIDNQDAIFNDLRLWQDLNHNGISESSELFTLFAKDIVELDLKYKKSKKTDEFGNEFRYRAKVWDAKKKKVGRWAWDVFLQLDIEQ